MEKLNLSGPSCRSCISLILVILMVCVGPVLSEESLLDAAAKDFVLGNFTSAQSKLETVLAAEPDNVRAKNLYDLLLKETGKTATRSSLKTYAARKSAVSAKQFQIIPDASLRPIVAGNRVFFRVRAVGAESVSVVGDFNEWDKAANPLKKVSGDLWEGEVFLEPGYYPYKFVINGEFLNDPNNPGSGVTVQRAEKKEMREEQPPEKFYDYSPQTIRKNETPYAVYKSSLNPVYNPNPTSRGSARILNIGTMAGIDGFNLVPRVFSDGLTQFTLYAPQAREVALVGDFNNWDPAATPMVMTPTGIWIARVRLAPGSYGYNYMVDGRLMQDPNNPLYVLDKYGNRNSLLNVELIDQPPASPPRPEFSLPKPPSAPRTGVSSPPEPDKTADVPPVKPGRSSRVQSLLEEIRARRSAENPVEEKKIQARSVSILAFQVYGHRTEEERVAAERVVQEIEQMVRKRDDLVLLRSEKISFDQEPGLISRIDEARGDLVISGSMLFRDGKINVTLGVRGSAESPGFWTAEVVGRVSALGDLNNKIRKELDAIVKNL